MTTVLALSLLYAAVQARFESEAGQITVLEAFAFAGTSVGALSGTPTSATKTLVLFTIGGNVGTPGIFYKVSTDDGTTFGAPVALDAGTTITVAGVTLTLGTGTVVDGDQLRWTTTDPNVVEQPFGWREPAKRSATFRIVWVPGDDQSGDLGEVGPARNPGRNSRPLATVQELFTVYIEARDNTAPQNELAQYTAARLLFDAWLRAVYLAAHGTFEIKSARWLADLKQSRAGATLRVLASVQAMVPDAPFEAAPADTAADVTTSELDVDEEDVISAS